MCGASKYVGWGVAEEWGPGETGWVWKCACPGGRGRGTGDGA